MFYPLLAPAVGLMNRLTYIYKFLLISLLFLLPLLSLGYLQLADISEAQRVTARQVQGLKVLHKTLALTELAARIRDLEVLQGAETDQENRLEPLRQRYSEQLDDIERDFRVLEAPDKLLEQSRLLRNLVSAPVQAGSADELTIYVDRNNLVLENWILVHDLSYFTGVYQDTDPHNFILMKTVLDAMEPLLKTQGHQRAFGTRVIKAGVMHTMVMDRLNTVLDALFEDQKRLASIFRPIVAAPMVYGNALSNAAQSITDTLARDTERFETDFFVEENFEYGVAEYFEHSSATASSIYQFIYTSLNFVQGRLEARAASQNQQLYLLLLILAAVVVITSYLMMAFTVSVRKSIDRILETAAQVANGDLTGRVTIGNKDELGMLAAKFNQMIERMRGLLSQVTVTADSVALQAQSVNSIAEQSSAAVGTQLHETEQIATAINQVAVSAHDVAERIQVASQESEEVDQRAEQGQQLVQNTLDDITQLSADIDVAMGVIHQLVKDSESISQVLDVIKGIAEQTNLLALNAAIEAARAGEQGRGFAVVADEVRTLAQRTQASTREIEEMITRLQSGVNDAVQAMEVSHEKVGHTVTRSSEVGATLQHISEAISRIVSFNTQIASAGEQQQTVVRELESNVHSISEVSNLTATGAEDTVSSCYAMKNQVDKLQRVVSSFSV